MMFSLKFRQTIEKVSLSEFVNELAKALENELDNENLSRDAFWRYFDFKNGIFSLFDNTRCFEELNQKMKSGYFFENYPRRKI